MTVLLRRMLNGACWGVTVAVRSSDTQATVTGPTTAMDNQTAILTATL